MTADSYAVPQGFPDGVAAMSGHYIGCHERSLYWIKKDEPSIYLLICRAAFALSAASFLVTTQGANAGGLPGLKPGHYLEQGVDCANARIREPEGAWQAAPAGDPVFAAVCKGG